VTSTVSEAVANFSEKCRRASRPEPKCQALALPSEPDDWTAIVYSPMGIFSKTNSRHRCC